MASKWKDKVNYSKSQGIQITLDYDFTPLKKLKADINVLNNRHIKVGWIDKRKHKGSGYYLAQLAHMQEFGSERDGATIPARPYFRQSFVGIKDVLRNNSAVVFKKLLNGQDYSQELEQIGYLSKIQFHNSVMRQNMTKLSEITSDKKGHAFQWDDTGEMLHGFSFKVFKSSLTKAENKASTEGNR